MKIKFIAFVFIALLSKGLSHAQVMINEFSCSNLSQYVDNHSDYNDWIELYNTSSSPVDLTGYYLSDDSLDNLKWQFPSGVSIAGYGFLRIWASGRDEVAGGHYHTNFKLTQTKSNNEYVVLSNPAGQRVDWIEIKQETKLGHSYGRTTNGGLGWSIYTTPTIGVSNVTSTAYVDYASRPQASLLAGYYPSTISVSLTTTEPSSSIRYTTNGSEPTASSTLYTGPISISSTTVLKAITLSTDPTILPSFVHFNTYFINVSHTIPVVSIAGYQLDVLANGSQSLRPIGSFEYFDVTKVRKAKTYGEFNSHGQDSWANSQRSLDFISRDEMGYSKDIKEQLFASTPRDEYQRVILRAAGDDNYPADHHSANLGSAHVRDAFIHNLAVSGNLNLDVRRGSKAIVYLNGQYWGVYDLRDNPDDHDYTEYYYGQDKFHLQYILTWGSTWAEYGGQQALDDWYALYNYIMTNDMAVPANYQYVIDRYDVESLVDYVLVNMFTVCSDWLNWNTGWWRGLDPNGEHTKWGYILWDNDATFGHYINYTGIPNTTYAADPCDPESLYGDSDPEGHIQILLRLRQNPDFNQYYLTRQFDLWNTIFSCDYMLNQLDSVVDVIDPEMTAHANRWSGTYSEWTSNVQTLRNFISNRCPALTSGFMDCYSVTGPYDLTLNTNGGGDVKINTVVINQFPWTGTYFGSINTDLQALPYASSTFSHWTAINHSLSPSTNNEQVSIALSTHDTITAYFSLASIAEHPEMPLILAMPSVFSGQTDIQYVLPSEEIVSINLYSLLGDEVFVLLNGVKQEPGKYVMTIDFAGHGLDPGVYVLDFISGQNRQSIRLVYTK